jgi:hypothetical protein
MLAVEKWAQGRNPLIAYFAINFALMAREQSEALRQIKRRRLYSHEFPLPDFPSWFAMYRSLKPLFAHKRFISDVSDYTDDQKGLLSELKKFDKLLKHNSTEISKLMPTPEQVELSWKYWREMCTKTFIEIQDDIDNSKFPIEIQEKIEKDLVRDELALGFYFLVYGPCQLIYKTTPSKLYEKALSGDISAIDKLLRLDPLTIHDPAIGYQIQSVRLYGKSNEYEQIINAIYKTPCIKYRDMKDERKSIKSDYGALIYLMAKNSKDPLKISQIRDLFDKLAHDFEGSRQDNDVTSPEGFDKTIKTKAADWQDMLQKPEKQK